MRTGFLGWLNKRLPVDQFVRDQLTGYYAPKNFNIWYFFGVAGAAGARHAARDRHLPHHALTRSGEATAFDSVEYIMREVPFGWLLRYMHSTGASFFFIVVYLHMFRALLYGSTRRRASCCGVRHAGLPRADGRGVHGLRAAVGQHVVLGRAGDHEPVRHHPGASGPAWSNGSAATTASRDATLNRFFSLHVVARAARARCCWSRCTWSRCARTGRTTRTASRSRRSSGADGKPLDGIPFHPYYTRQGHRRRRRCSSSLFAIVVFFVPTFGGLFLEAPNFEPANPLSTPEHIAPVWYFTPFYAILRAVPDQQLGALLMALSVAAFLFLPWLDRAPGQVDPLPRLAVEGRCSACSSSRSWCSMCLGLQARRGHLRAAGAHLHGAVLRVLHPAAVRTRKADGNGPVPDRVTYHAH